MDRKNGGKILNYPYLRDKRMTLKVKGLLYFMPNLPLDWDYSLDGLEKICKEGKDSIRSSLNELKLYGYRIINKKQNDKEDREDKPKSSFFDAYKHNILTLKLIDRKYIPQYDIQLYFYDSILDELLKENSYVDLIMVLHYILARAKLE